MVAKTIKESVMPAIAMKKVIRLAKIILIDSKKAD